MKNREIAERLYEVADFLEIEDVEYKPRAYRTAARNVESLSEDIEDVYERGELEEIEGVGESIAEKIADYLETSEMTYHRELKAGLPVDMEALTSVEGVGPKTVKSLYNALGVATLEDLERAAEEGRIAEVEGFGETSQQNILEHVDLAKRGQERMLLGRAFPLAESLETHLVESETFGRVDVVGSFRRRRPTVGDIDILATAVDAEAAMNVFCGDDDVEAVLARGETKASVVASGDLHVDLRIVDESEYGAGLVYFTGSKDHNIALRNRAIDRELKLNEYGLFDVRTVDNPRGGRRIGERIASETESEVYRALDLEWIPPELREETGEIEAAADGTLPELVETADIRGDLHVHTEYSDGSLGVREMAEAADDRDLEYILVSDHGPEAPIPSRIDRSAFGEQRADIDAVNEDDDLAVTVLQGIEAEITDDGLGIDEDWCDSCDLVVGAVHGSLSDPTAAVCRALEDWPVDVLAHPTNRLLNEREPLDVDLDVIATTAGAEDVAFEINAQPERLDLAWSLVKEYREAVSFAVSTDAHTAGELDFMRHGVSQARRGWCEPEDVLNTRPLEDVLSVLPGADDGRLESSS